MTNDAPRIAVVTGGSSGIGAAAARALARDGWTVVTAARNAENLDAVAARAQGGAGTVDPVPTDVTDEASVTALFDHVTSTYGRVDLLFNNAGISAPAREIDEVPLQDWNTMIAVNITGMFLCARAAFGAMRRQDPQGGRIINNGSLSAYTPRPQSIGYSTSKHAISGMTKSLSLDGRKYRIACGQIDVGNAATHMTDRMSDGVLQPDGRRLSEPTMDVEHVADAVVQMADLPFESNIAQMSIMATTMPFVGRG